MSGDDPVDRETDPEDAFGRIGNATRAEILRVLGDAGYEELSFSELRSRVEGNLDSSQFNYHLQQLLGEFVERTDDGYQILPEGLTVYRAVRAGTFNRRASVGPFAAGFDCYYCDHPVEASYHDGMFEIACPDCEHVYSFTRVPPSAVEDADPEEVLRRIDQYTRHERLACVRGVCPHCVHELAIEFTDGDDLWFEGAERHEVLCERGCDYCGFSYYLAVGQVLLHSPLVIAFLESHGVDVAETPHWEFEFAMTDHSLEVRSRDPWEFGVGVSAGGDTKTFVVDEELDVTVAEDTP